MAGPQNLNLALVITADAKGVAPAATEARRQIDGVAQSAKATTSATRLLSAASAEAVRGQQAMAAAAQGRSAAESQLRNLVTASAEATGASAQSTALATHQVANLSYQMNDIATMLVSGQSFGVIMMQQGMQIAQIFGRRGLGEIIPALGTSILSLISPTTLVLGGITALGYAASYAFDAMSDDIQDVDELLARHEELIKRIEKRWPEAAKSARQYSLESAAVLAADHAALERDLRATVSRQATDLYRNATSLRMPRSEFATAFGSAVADLKTSMDAGRPAILAYLDALAKIETAKYVTEEQRELAHSLRETGKEGADAERALSELPKSLDNIGVASRRAKGYVDEFAEAFGKLRELSMPNLTPREEAFEVYKRAAAAALDAKDAAAAYGQYKEALARLDAEDAAAAREFLTTQQQRVQALQKELAVSGETIAVRDRVQAQLRAEEEIRRRGFDAASEEAAAIRSAYEEQARLNRLIQQRAATSDYITTGRERIAQLQIEMALLGSSEQFRARVIAQMEAEREIRELGIDTTSKEAQTIRANTAAHAELTTELERQAAAWDLVRSSGEAAIDAVFDSLADGDFEGALAGLADEMKSLSMEFIKNPVKNWLTGSNLPTFADAGGFGGILGRLFGGGDNLAQSALSSITGVGAMTVTAGTVMVNGTGVGGGLGDVAKLFTGDGSKTAGGLDMSSFAQAIKSIESSGNYGALGPITASGDRAYGAYQIMGNNIGPWSKAALGQSISISDFLKSPSLQDKIFANQFGGYVNQFGPTGAAKAWFGGAGAVTGSGGVTDILGTSVDQYAQKFNAALSGMTDQTKTAAQGLGELGSGFDKFGQALSSAFPPAPNGGALSQLFGAGVTFASMWSISPLATQSIMSGKIGLFASGTEAAPPGWAWVGEDGPELMRLRGGDTIRSNGRSMQMMADASRPSVMQAATPQITFINRGTPQREVERREEDDGNGGRRVTFVLEDMVAGGMKRPGSAAHRALRDLGVAGRVVRS